MNFLISFFYVSPDTRPIRLGTLRVSDWYRDFEPCYIETASVDSFWCFGIVVKLPPLFGWGWGWGWGLGSGSIFFFFIPFIQFTFCNSFTDFKWDGGQRQQERRQRRHTFWQVCEFLFIKFYFFSFLISLNFVSLDLNCSQLN